MGGTTAWHYLFIPSTRVTHAWCGYVVLLTAARTLRRHPNFSPTSATSSPCGRTGLGVMARAEGVAARATGCLRGAGFVAVRGPRSDTTHQRERGGARYLSRLWYVLNGATIGSRNFTASGDGAWSARLPS